MSTFTAKIVAELDTSKIPSAIEKIKNQKVTLQNVQVNKVELSQNATSTLATQVQNALNSKTFTVNINGVKVNGNVTGSAGNSIGQKISDSINKNIAIKIDTKQYEAQISSLQAKLTKLDVVPGNGKFSGIKSELEQIRVQYEALKNNSTGDLVGDAKKLEQALAKVKSELSVAASEAGTFVSKFKINAFDDKLTKWLQSNTRAIKNFGPQIDQLRERFRSLGDSVTPEQLKAFEAELKSIDAAAAAAGQKGKTFADQFKGAFASITKYVSASTLIYQAINAAKQMAKAVYEIDTAMTELKKVTDETAATYDKFLSNAGEKAKQMGVAISDYITSVADFARLGYDFKEAQSLADVANIYNVVGDDVDNIETATQTVISSLTAFGIAASDAITIVDELNSVGNAFAISSGGLGDALTRSASSMAAANNTLEESIGLISAANTVVQDPESVGNRLPTLKVAISVKSQRWLRPRKDLMGISA